MHQIGAGALGPVFRAYEPDQDRLVAVKLFRLDLPPERVHQFVGELEQLIAADLTHPSIAAPIAAGISGTSAYLAQDFVAADSLDIVVRDHGPAPASDALRVAAQLGGALDFAAAVDVVHGAMHPRDVLISPDDTRVIGHGIARALERVGVEPMIRRPYAAPERAAHGPWDRRADIYTLASLIFEMLAGKRLAVPADRAGEMLVGAPGASQAALKQVFARALADDPAKRFDSALEFADALKSALTVTVLPAAARPQPRPTASASRAARGAPRHAERSAAEHGADMPAIDMPATDTPGNPAVSASSEKEIGLPFEEPVASDSLAVDRVIEAVDAPIDLQLHDEPVIQLREEREEVVIEREPAGAVNVDAVERTELATFAEPGAPDAPRPRERRLQSAREQPAGEERSPVVNERRRAPLPPAPASSASASSPQAEPEIVRAAASAPRSPTAFLDQSSDEFRESALEKTRSAIWPLALAIGVGLVVGFAGGYGVAMRDRAMPSLDSAPPPAVAQAAPPATTAPPLASSSAATAPPDAEPGAAASAQKPPADAGRESSGGAAAAAGATVGTTAEPRPGSDDASRRRAADTAPVATIASGRLLVRSTPAGARVAVDGRDAGPTPATVRDLARGPHTVRVTQDGYLPEERRIVLTDERMSQAMRFELTRKPVPGAPPAAPAGPGGLMVESRPTGASVLIDGRLVGTTPLAIESVAAGDHSIALESDGYQRWVASVRVTTGERARVTASLER